MYYQPDAQRFQRTADVAREPLGQRHDVGGKRIGNIAEVIDVLFRDDHQFARVDGADAHEAEARLILVDPAARRPPGNYFAKHAGGSFGPHQRR